MEEWIALGFESLAGKFGCHKFLCSIEESLFLVDSLLHFGHSPQIYLGKNFTKDDLNT